MVRASTMTLANITPAPSSMWSFPPYPSARSHIRHKWALLKEKQVEKAQAEHKGPVLVVEDDPDILSSVADILDFEGYEVETAVDGSMALSVLERVQPTLILLDMRMPVLNGWEFARLIKERGIRVPILVMTA